MLFPLATIIFFFCFLDFYSFLGVGWAYSTTYSNCPSISYNLLGFSNLDIQELVIFLGLAKACTLGLFLTVTLGLTAG